MEMPMEVVRMCHNQHPTKRLQKVTDHPRMNPYQNCMAHHPQGENVANPKSGSQTSQSRTPEGLE